MTLENMHIPLMFFPKVTSDEREAMATLIQRSEWNPIIARTSRTVLLGRGALAVELELDPQDLAKLEDRLIRPSISAGDNSADLRGEPLGLVSLMQGEPDLERKRRRFRTGAPLRLHVTIARVRGEVMELIHPPPMLVHLEQLAVFESDLRQEGAIYTKICFSSG